MRKLYSRRRSAFLRNGIGPVVGGLAVLAVLALLLRLLAPGALVAVASPFWHAGQWSSDHVAGITAVFHDRATLIAERDAANTRIDELTAHNAALAAKAADLTKLLGDRAESHNTTLAGVLVRPPVAPYDTLVIDQGTAGGVAAGAAAYGPGGVPVGVVASVTQFSARVVLYSAPGQETSAWVGDTRIPIDLIGLGGGAFYAEAPREASTTVGDLVYAAGPGALPIGSIARVDSDPSSPKAVVRVAPAIDPFSLTWVTIEKR